MDAEAMFSVTDQYTADKISAEIKKRIILHDNVTVKSIVDATACIGGNTMSFARYFDHVYAVEIDNTRYGYLRFNIQLLGLTNVSLQNADMLAALDQLPSMDVIFIDPPWGGPNYKSQDKLTLSLSGIPLSDVCQRLAEKRSWKYIVLKVPTNFDVDSFDALASSCMTRIPSSTKFRKLLLLIYKISIP